MQVERVSKESRKGMEIKMGVRRATVVTKTIPKSSVASLPNNSNERYTHLINR